ncbi:MAG: galactokinase [Hymenobacter sp.]|nr:MAG: galactokinase [Hymenobacter sp.]
MLSTTIPALFQQRFGHAPLVVRAPGRINLIGEHTDYNNGLVLPAAIDKEVIFAIGLNGTAFIRLLAHDLDEQYEVALANVQPVSVQWANYLLGVVAQFQQRGVAVPGFDCVFGGNIPMGAGLSSSAAVECGLAFALNELLSLGLDRLALAKLGQAAEHQYAGVQCGLMDQFASLFGQPGQVVRLDCRSLDYAYFPFDAARYHLVLCNSGVKHALASSAYNTRRQECAEGVAILQRHYPTVASLRDATLAQLAACRLTLGEVVYHRCRYVVEENERVKQACTDLMTNDITSVGQLLYASHAGLRDDYAVSCPELDKLVALATDRPGVLGARMMGGGFGGCTLNLVEAAHVSSFMEGMAADFLAFYQRELEMYQTTIVGGVSVTRQAELVQ